MPNVRLSRTGGARREVTYLGISQRSSGGNTHSPKRALRERKNLVREAKLLAGSSDWKAGGEQLIRLQQRWRALGSAGQDPKQLLWRRFKTATDEFHRRRVEHFTKVERAATISAQAKGQLIARARELGVITDYRVAKRQFDDLMRRWRAAGHAGKREEELWIALLTARQVMYNATELDRISVEAAYVRELTERIEEHRAALGKQRTLRRELTLRRQRLTTGWVGAQMAEELDERVARLDEQIGSGERRLEQDRLKLEQAKAKAKEIAAAAKARAAESETTNLPQQASIA
jgi:uncharacterized protein DUF349